MASPPTATTDWPGTANRARRRTGEIVGTDDQPAARRLPARQPPGHHAGHGSEPGEARLYQPGDDVRRIDWNVTARTMETHVRSRSPTATTAWLIVDTSASMRFETTVSGKSQIALAAAAGVGFLTARNQNRLGAVLVAGPRLGVMPPRIRRRQVRAVLTAARPPPQAEGLGRADLVAAIDRVAVISRRRVRRGDLRLRRRGLGRSLARLGLRHDLLAITVHDPRARRTAGRDDRGG